MSAEELPDDVVSAVEHIFFYGATEQDIERAVEEDNHAYLAAFHFL